jgi:hypothetical protein
MLCPPTTFENGVRDCIYAAPDATCVARVCYHNDEAQSSVQGFHTITLAGRSYRLRVDVGAEETITLEPPPGYTVWPADDAVQSIRDGTSALFCVVGGMM